MIWQDAVIALVIAMFTISVIPMVRSDFTPPYATSIMMTVGSVILGVVYITLSLWLSLSVEVISTLLWGTLVYQRGQPRRVARRNANKVIEEWRAEDPDFWNQVDRARA